MTATGQRTAGVGSGRWARVAAVAVLGLGIEFARALGERSAEVPAGIAGGLLLCTLALPWARRPAALGLAPGRWAGRAVGAAALTAVLLLPAAVRWPGHPPLAGWEAAMAIVIAAGEELAFRGALYAALDQVAGPAVAVGGSALAWTAAHVFSHPPEFMPAVFTAGLVLGLWRWAARDLAAPIAAHALSDLLL